MRANQLRLYLSTVAYVLIRALREHGLKDTEMEKAQCGTIRQNLFTIGAVVPVSVRRVVLAMSESYPFQELFAAAFDNLRRLITPSSETGLAAVPTG